MTYDERWPAFDDDEVEAVVRVLRSGNVNRWTGEENREFERAFAEFVSTDFSVALANGTVALEVALHCLDIRPGDDVVVTSRSFVASAGAVALVGGRPVFADVDPESQNVTAETIEEVLTDRTRAVVVVHLGGWICDMAPIMDLAEARNLVVIEDCAQALGASYGNRPAGSWGHAATWSFCQDKIMTTGGEGGMLTTRDRNVWERAWSFKDHGKSLLSAERLEPTPSFRWVHDSLGSNLRMTEMQAAIGRVALGKVAGRVDRRNEIARRIDDRLSPVDGIRTTVPPPHVRHAYYKYYAFVRPEAFRDGWSRDDVLIELHRNDVPAYAGICPEIYREHAFESAGYAPQSRHPVAKDLGETAIMLPIHHNLSDATVSRWSDTVERVIEGACR